MTQVTQTSATEVTPPPQIPDDSTFGARLALIRQMMHWGNVAQAARECGVPTDSWRNWEEGMEPRRLVTIAMAIAARANVDVDWLLKGPSAAALRERAELTGWNVRDLLDSTLTRPPEARVIVRGRSSTGRIEHGDARRKPRRPDSEHPARNPRPTGHGTRPVTVVALGRGVG
jgi:hypothetical protein